MKLGKGVANSTGRTLPGGGAVGRTISGEHGIGHKRKQFVPLVLDEAAITAMKSIKKALDPRLILNPGKLWA